MYTAIVNAWSVVLSVNTIEPIDLAGTVDGFNVFLGSFKELFYFFRVAAE